MSAPPDLLTISVDIDRSQVVATPILLPLGVHPRVTYEEFLRLCAVNDVADFEWDPDGTLYVMSPAGGHSGRKNAILTAQLVIWANSDTSGVAFDSSTGFTLPDGKVRSPDAAWIRKDRWHALTPAQRDAFPPLAPDFIAELRSPTDSLNELLAKMELYRQNGVRLGWLIDPIDHAVDIYRPGQPTERLENPRTVDGGDVLPGFTLDLKGILFDDEPFAA